MGNCALCQELLSEFSLASGWYCGWDIKRYAKEQAGGSGQEKKSQKQRAVKRMQMAKVTVEEELMEKLKVVTE